MEPPIHSRSRSSSSHPPFINRLGKNGSFAKLARLVGLSPDPQPDDELSDGDEPGSSSTSDAGDFYIGYDDDDDDDDDDADSHNNDGRSEEVDEQSLLWDAQVRLKHLPIRRLQTLMQRAQTALIAHQPSLAAKYYSTAALPPFRSAPACLALGNLLARGSGLSQSDTESTVGSPVRENFAVESNTPASPTSWFASLFRSTSPPPSPTSEKQPRRLVTNGWSLPTDGKRVIRDVEGMGRAGGWLILGVGWLIDDEVKRSVVTPTPYRHQQTQVQLPTDDENMILFSSKGKESADHSNRSPPVHDSSDPGGRNHPTRSVASSITDSTDYSTVLCTPGEGSGDKASDESTIKLLVSSLPARYLFAAANVQYDLIMTLLQLYRHGHIQRHDPVALPPIPFAQLPQVLQPHGDKEKGRNVWYLGGVVAARVLELPLLHNASLSTESRQKRDGVIIMAQYIVSRDSTNGLTR